MRAFTTATANMTGRTSGIMTGDVTTAGAVLTTVAGWLTTAVVAEPAAPTVACSSLGPAAPAAGDRRETSSLSY